jgi:predicted MFS family arabinose efflux permease
MAVYSATVVVTAPVWAGLSRRIALHRLVQFGLFGQVAAMALLLLPPSNAVLVFARGLQGVFASAVLPALQIAASRASTSEADRSLRLADLSRGALVGGLFGPGLGGAVANDGRLWAPVLVAMLALTLAGVVQRSRIAAIPTVSPVAPQQPKHRREVALLLALAALAAAAMSVYEVGLATRARLVDGLSPRDIGFMFTGCGVVMLLSQALVFRRGHDPTRAFGWVAPAFLATAVGLALLAWLGGVRASVAGVVLVAASAGVLQPALTYWTSRAAGASEASSLGWRTAVTTAGQAAGSLAGGMAFAPNAVGRIALVTLIGGLLAAAALAQARRRAPAGIHVPISPDTRPPI